jgi:hypothetical protein
MAAITYPISLDDFYIIKKDPPHDGVIWLDAKAEIRENRTGCVHISQQDVIWDEENECPHTYIWSEGNFSCDCNRALFFNGKYTDDMPCGDGGYSVNLYSTKTGQYFYKEF